MTLLRSTLFVAVVLLGAPLIHAQASESSITKQIDKLRSLSDAERPTATIKLAADISTLPAGLKKVTIADSLAHLVTEGDQGEQALQAVADTLSQALTQSPVPAKTDQPPMPYRDLASLVRYKGVTTTLSDPLLAKAVQVLANNEADVQKADFTLRDFHNKKYTLSQLRGKIVLVNFWESTCPPCRKEMPDLDVIYTHFGSQLVVLSITDEEAPKVVSLVSQMGYHPPVLFDTDSKVHKLFHVEGIPRNFVFDAEGKLIAQSIDECTQRQLLDMLAKAGLHN